MQGDVRHVLAKSETKPFGETRRSSFSEDKPMRAANTIDRVARLELYGALWFVVAS
jgi:hypothetical protein